MSKAEQMSPEFLKMNPKHEVPVFDHNGTFVTESREIAKYFHENFNTAPEENDHWYPCNPEERKKVKIKIENKTAVCRISHGLTS